MTTRRLCYLTQAAPNHAGSRQAAGRVLNGRRRRLRWRWQRQAWVMMTNDKKRVSEVRCDKWIDGWRMITDSGDSVRIGNRIFARSLANNCHSWWSVPNGRRPSCETLYLRYIDRIFDHDFDLHKVRSFSAILQPQICCVFDFQLKVRQRVCSIEPIVHSVALKTQNTTQTSSNLLVHVNLLPVANTAESFPNFQLIYLKTDEQNLTYSVSWTKQNAQKWQVSKARWLFFRCVLSS